MVTTKLNLSMTEPQVRQIYAKQGDTGRVLDISLDQTPEDGTLRILRPDGVEVTSEAVTGGEVESGSSFESLTEADVTELTVGIEPVQDLNGYDAPWVGGAGKNKLPYPYTIASSGTINGVTYTVNGDGSITLTGTATGQVDLALFSPNGYSLDSGTYKITLGGIKNGIKWIYGGSGSAITYNELPHTVADQTFDVTSSGTCGYCIIRIANGTATNTTLYPMIRLATEADAAFEPYSNICPITGYDEVRVYFGAEQGTADETYTTSLGQTVYGGTLDMASGVLTVDKAMVDMGSLNWGRYNEIQTAYVYLASLVSQGMDTSSAKLLSSVFKCRDSWTGLTNLANGEMQSHPSLAYAYARCDSYTSASDFKTAVTGQQLVYELATPLTYTLTAQQIKTLVGTNNVWASSGDIVSIAFTYGGLLSELPSEATSVVGKCYCDVEQNGVSSMPFTLNVKKNERES